jgi:NADPH:quinone reductase-like Zn-dependent oxidoreductase
MPVAPQAVAVSQQGTELADCPLETGHLGHGQLPRAYGPLDVLRFQDIDQPTLGPGEVLIHVCAAGVDPSIWHLTSGEPYLIRLMGFGLRRPKIPVPGLELAGTIEEVGPGVIDLRPGDEVFGTADGSFAEYAVVKVSRVVPKPNNLTFDQAAAVPVSACTAMKGLQTVRSGQRLLRQHLTPRAC